MSDDLSALLATMDAAIADARAHDRVVTSGRLVKHLLACLDGTSHEREAVGVAMRPLTDPGELRASLTEMAARAFKAGPGR